MITFRCRCSHRFSVADDRAGESFQCPSCGLLVDVPTLEDAQSLEDDGSYVLRDSIARVRDELPDVADAPSIVTRTDTSDRRLSLSEFLKIGTSDDDLLQIKGEVQAGVPTHPKYDPVTGELIVPIEVRREPIVAQPLIAQPIVLGYEVTRGGRTANIWLPFTEMFRAPNLIVNAIVALMCYGSLFAIGVLNPLAVLALPLLLMVIAHFANVVDETGPTNNDELPRPMRGANLYEDVLRPLLQVLGAYMLANLPIVLINLYVTRLPPLADAGLSVLFFVLVPALLLTLITSGALNNLVPHRAFSVISAGGWDYWVTCVLGYVGTLALGIATIFALSSGENFVRILSKGQVGAGLGNLFGLPHWLEMSLAPVIMFLAVFLVHCFAWQLGLLYRLHHDGFAWVLQKHDKSARTDTLAQLHLHRQKQVEAKAKQARENLERRQRAAPKTNARPR